jgi:hypothetical protein
MRKDAMIAKPPKRMLFCFARMDRMSDKHLPNPIWGKENRTMKMLAQRTLLALALVALITVLMMGTTSTVDAAPTGFNGQQVMMSAANRNSQGQTLPGFVELVVTGNNQQNRRVTWTWRNGTAYSVTTTNWWWKGAVTIQAKYANGATKTCSGNVPTISLSNTYTITCSSDVPNLAPVPPSNPRLGNIAINSMTLTWDDKSGSVNGETGFSIERRTTGSWSQIQVVGANVTSFTNTGLTMGTVYCYRVRAYNATGTAIASNFQTTLIQVVFALANPSAVTTLG